MDYYEILGIKKDVSQEEIKKAFRKLSFTHHPDKGGNEEEFKKINEAYATLGDEEKRKQYDNRGKNPFENFASGFNSFADMFGNSFYQNRKRGGPDKIVEVNLTIKECFLGTDKTISYTRKIQCNPCRGNGGKRTNCTTCNGQGFTTVRTGTGLFIQVLRQICPTCNGVGQMVVEKCVSCNGEGTSTKMDTVSIKIPQGVDEGTFLRIEERGDFVQGVYGNLILRLRVLNDELFEKSGKDLIFNATFGLNDLKKENLEIPHPLGLMNVKLPEIFDTSVPLRIKYKGFKSPEGSGDLFIKLNVKFKRDYL
jgi:molecular chaperone DnaJ